MSVVNWGQLPKSQVDNEKIEEAIARLIQAHDDDPTAHLDSGQALQSHKASSIIDHAINSIIRDKIKMGEVDLKKLTANNTFIFTTFDSLDGWRTGGVGTPTIDCVIGGTKLETSGANNDTAWISAAPAYGFGEGPNFDALPFAQVLLKIMDKGNAEVHFHIGQEGFQSAGNDYIGFFFDQSKVYAVCRKSGVGETKEEITSPPDPENPHIYRIVYESSSSVKFYIDGVLKKTITTNIPTGDGEDSVIFLGVKNSHNAGEQTMGVYHAIYQEG